ncbi:MAG TPA: isoleucine--tRNA ligase, partial [Candidatus Acidoferrales bacterium]
MTKASELKGTLNLPHTGFPMKASLPQAEPRQLAEWEEKGIYRRILESRAGAPEYVLHDGPPYPTGEITLGTGLNKVLKDLVVKSKTMAGFRAPYLPGWDCHGLPIETKVEKELGGKDKLPPAEFRRMCRDFAARYIDNHRREFKRLGIFGQWEKPYLTMDYSVEAAIAEAFVTFYEKGYVYRGLKPVYWCIYDSTALAEAEVEYEDHTSPSIWVKFPVAPGGAAGKLGADVAAAAWTTTPWSLPGTNALAFHPQLEYVVVETDSGNLLLAADRVVAASMEIGLKGGRIRGAWKGSDLEGIEFQHPFLDVRLPAVLADYVTLDRGTGVVTTAPGHGAEDFHTGQKYGLKTLAPVDDQGRFVEGLPEYLNKTVFEANAGIADVLRQRGMLLHLGKLTHSYPHCWRCHNPVIFRATEQWFIHLDAPPKNVPGATMGLRQMALEAIEGVHWKPQWGHDRIGNMIATRPDWCVSRQRFWGVPLIVFYCQQCNEQLLDFRAHHHVVEVFKREGSDAWFARPAEDLVPTGTMCQCGSTRFRKETDILDVWFESGSTQHAVLGTPEAGHWPADCYLEGPDQHRGWFQSSLLVALGVKGKAPYGTVVTHGWTLDAQGTPMSKSLGNAIYPAEIYEKWGADLMRLWVTSQDYTADMSNSQAMMTQLAEAYRKLRNTFRYALGNLYDFDPARDALPAANLLEMDQWMLARTAQLVDDCRRWYDEFEFHRVFHAIHDFAVVDLSATYFDILKDRLYTSAPRSSARRSAQTALYRIASALVRLLTPILVFTAEEIWKYFPKQQGEPESIHMAEFPSAAEMGATPGET